MSQRAFRQYKINGQNVRVFVADRHTETAVVLLHGWGANATLYSGILEQLGAKYTVIAPNLPGFGGSEEPREAWSVDDYTDFCVALITELQGELGFKAVSLIGHSYGGRIIIKMCGEHANAEATAKARSQALPFAIDKLVLIDSAGIKHENATVSKKTARYKRLKKFWTESVFSKIAPKFSQKMLEKAKVHYGSADYRAASPRMRECLVKAVNEDLSALLPSIKYPTLLIWGDKDTSTPLADGKLMEEKIPDAGLCVLEGAGHFSYAEQPAQCARILASYFEL